MAPPTIFGSIEIVPRLDLMDSIDAPLWAIPDLAGMTLKFTLFVALT
jgi:hypothetical protein